MSTTLPLMPSPPLRKWYPSLLPFLKAVCCSKKSWQARCWHPDCAADCYHDGLRRLAPSSQPCATAAPYGIESFGEGLKSLWLGIHLHRRKGLATFLKVLLWRLTVRRWTHCLPCTAAPSTFEWSTSRNGTGPCDGFISFLILMPSHPQSASFNIHEQLHMHLSSLALASRY